MSFERFAPMGDCLAPWSDSLEAMDEDLCWEAQPMSEGEGFTDDDWAQIDDLLRQS